MILQLLVVFLAIVVADTLAALDPTNLFPIAVTSGFSTVPAGTALPSQVSLVALSDDALGVHNITSGLTHNVVTAQSAPAGTQAWQAVYPQGSWNPSGSPKGGFGFYLAGPDSFDFTKVNELLFSYAVFFPAGFQFNMGGKLPGPYGGTTPDEANRCSGGRQQDRDLCFDLRLMWRTDAVGEIYAYLPEDPANNVLTELAGTVVDDTFGTSIARGAYSFATGDWTVVAQRVKLNTPGKADGELELFVNGQSVIHATQVLMRHTADSVFRGAHFQTFFGGSNSSWASPSTQSTFFADVSAGAVKPGASPADGKAPYPLNTTLSAAPTSGTPHTGNSGQRISLMGFGGALIIAAVLAAICS